MAAAATAIKRSTFESYFADAYFLSIAPYCVVQMSQAAGDDVNSLVRGHVEKVGERLRAMPSRLVGEASDVIAAAVRDPAPYVYGGVPYRDAHEAAVKVSRKFHYALWRLLDYRGACKALRIDTDITAECSLFDYRLIESKWPDAFHWLQGFEDHGWQALRTCIDNERAIVLARFEVAGSDRDIRSDAPPTSLPQHGSAPQVSDADSPAGTTRAGVEYTRRREYFFDLFNDKESDTQGSNAKVLDHWNSLTDESRGEIDAKSYKAIPAGPGEKRTAAVEAVRQLILRERQARKKSES